ncbi:MAG TPA: metal-dependent hydrolase, partial [Pseudolysinimonas sp.]
LNAALAGAWSKETGADGLGSPDFDGTAIETSTILENGSRDVYRVGKSVRKKGFDPVALEDTAGVASTVNATLASWIATGGRVHIDRDGERLTDRRYWVAELPGGSARIACGGTHVSSLAELGAVTVSLTTEQLDGGIGMTMETRVRARPS